MRGTRKLNLALSGVLTTVLTVGVAAWGSGAQAPRSQLVTTATSSARLERTQSILSRLKTRKASQASNQLTTPTPEHIGLFVSDSPSDSVKALATLDWAQSAGVDVLYNYASYDGSPAQVLAYLDAAQARHIQIIFSLADLYDQLPNGAETAGVFEKWGSSNEAIALAVTKAVQGHPATYGFGLTDEHPATSDDLAIWKPILSARYQKLKALTTKPVMAVLVGWTSGVQRERQALLRGLLGCADHFALDYYPVPFEDPARISSIARDALTVGDEDSWFIEQAFSWSSYPATITGLGYQQEKSRFPTSAEMVSMGRSALAGGATSLMFYSYFDIARHPDQLVAVKQAIAQLREKL